MEAPHGHDTFESTPAPGAQAVQLNVRHARSVSKASPPPPEQAGNPPSLSARGERAVWVDLLLVALLIVVVAVFYARYAIRVGNFQDDEEQYLQVARYVAAHFPSALWKSGLFVRGSQRLDQLVLAPPFALIRGPGVFELAHAIQSLLFASAALPVLLLARRAGLGRAAGLFAAALAVVVPWAVVSTSFLTECIAYPAFCWVLYATWVAARHPCARNDALALLALVFAALSRTALLALAPLLPLAVLWHEWGWKLRDLPRLQRAHFLPKRLWSAHKLLTIIVGGAVLVLVAGRLDLLPGRGLAALTGKYGLPRIDSLSSLVSRYEVYLSRLVVGTGFLAAALALPWIVANLARPRDGGRHALASVCALGVAVVLLSLLRAGPDERYVLYGTAPIALAAAGILREWAYAPRRSLGQTAGVLAATAAVLALIDGVAWPELTNTYDFFSYPAATFYRRAILLHLSSLRLPLLHPSPQLFVYLLIATFAFGVAALSLVKRAARPVAAFLAVGLVGLCAIQTIYALHKFSETAGATSGPNADQRSWVDRSLPDNAQVAALGISLGTTSDYQPVWRTTEFWNTSVRYNSFFGTSPGLLPRYSESRPLKTQANSGLLSAKNESERMSPRLVPSYMLVPSQGTNSVGLDARLVAHDPYLPLELVRLNQPPRIDWSVDGTSPEGDLPIGKPATATVYSSAFTGPRPRCAHFSLIPPPNPAMHWSYRVASAGHTFASAALSGSQPISVSVPLLPQASTQGPSAKLAIYAKAPPVVINGVVIGVKLAFFSVISCSARGR